MARIKVERKIAIPTARQHVYDLCCYKNASLILIRRAAWWLPDTFQSQKGEENDDDEGARIKRKQQ